MTDEILPDPGKDAMNDKALREHLVCVLGGGCAHLDFEAVVRGLPTISGRSSRPPCRTRLGNSLSTSGSHSGTYSRVRPRPHHIPETLRGDSRQHPLTPLPQSWYGGCASVPYFPSDPEGRSLARNEGALASSCGYPGRSASAFLIGCPRRLSPEGVSHKVDYQEAMVMRKTLAIVLSVVVLLGWQGWRGIRVDAQRGGPGDPKFACYDTSFNIGDPIYMLNWLFLGGPAPKDCHGQQPCLSPEEVRLLKEVLSHISIEHEQT